MIFTAIFIYLYDFLIFKLTKRKFCFWWKLYRPGTKSSFRHPECQKFVWKLCYQL